MTFFNSAIVYQNADSESLPKVDQESLSKDLFKDIELHEIESIGWTPIFPDNQDLQDTLVHSIGNDLKVVAFKTESKVIPADYIKKLLKAKVKQVEENEDRKLPRKQINELKDSVIFDLLPRAMTKTLVTLAILDYKNNQIIVNTGSHKGAEGLISLLRKSLGSLPIVPLTTTSSPSDTMTQWLLERSPDQVSFNSKATLYSVEEESSKVQLKNINLLLPEVTNHISSGYKVESMAIEWAEKLSLTIGKSFEFKAIKLSDVAVSDAGLKDEVDNPVDAFNANILIFNGVFNKFLLEAVNWFGGLAGKS